MQAVKPAGVGRCNFVAHGGSPLIRLGCGPGFMTVGDATGTDVFVSPIVIPAASATAVTTMPIHPGFPVNQRGRMTNAVFFDAIPARSARPSAHASDTKIQPSDGSFASKAIGCR